MRGLLPEDIADLRSMCSCRGSAHDECFVDDIDEKSVGDTAFEITRQEYVTELEAQQRHWINERSLA